MRELSTIQKREKLNRVFASDEPGAGSANYEYDRQSVITVRSLICEYGSGYILIYSMN